MEHIQRGIWHFMYWGLFLQAVHQRKRTPCLYVHTRTVHPLSRQGCVYHITAALAARAHDGKSGIYGLELKCPLTCCGGLLELCVRTCGLHDKGSSWGGWRTRVHMQANWLWAVTYIASINYQLIVAHFGHEGLCQLRTNSELTNTLVVEMSNY